MVLVRRFAFIGGRSAKFWEVQVMGSDSTIVATRWGRIGTPGQTKDYRFQNAQNAKGFVQKKVSEKLKKGYIEISLGAENAKVDVPVAEYADVGEEGRAFDFDDEKEEHAA